MRSITVSDIISATTTNALQGSRLQSFPGPGLLSVEFEASAGDASNYWDLSLFLPDGQVPFNNLKAPANAQGLAGVLVATEQFFADYAVAQGGTAQFSATLTGTSVLVYRLTWRG